nr:hypothetical protein [Tanacetum cinerariifolium]
MFKVCEEMKSLIGEVLEAKTVKVLKVGTEHNGVDALTKVVPGLKLQHCLELLNVERTKGENRKLSLGGLLQKLVIAVQPYSSLDQHFSAILFFTAIHSQTSFKGKWHSIKFTVTTTTSNHRRHYQSSPPPSLQSTASNTNPTTTAINR